MSSTFEKFSKKLIELYSKNRQINEFMTIERFNPQNPKNTEFIQIGVRKPIPKDIFEEEGDKYIAYDIATGITYGERNYVISKLLELNKDKQTNISDFKEISNHVNSIGNIRLFAFIGISGIKLIGDNKKITVWRGNDPNYGKGDFLILPCVNFGMAKIIWVEDKIIGNNILIISEESVKAVQKVVTDMIEIPEISNYGKYSSNDNYIDISIGNSKKYINHYDIYVKSILGLNILNKNQIYSFNINIQS